MQRALIQYRDPKNYYLVREALMTAHREDLIGSGPKCLIRAVPPRKPTTAPPPKGKPPVKAGSATKAQTGRKPSGPPPKAPAKGRPKSAAPVKAAPKKKR